MAIISRFGSIGGIEEAGKWQAITPDPHGDWLNQRDAGFDAFLPLGAKDKTTEVKLFETFSLGIATGRDAWCFNPSRQALATNMKAMIAAYNSELQRFNAAHPTADRRARAEAVDRFIDTDPRRINWPRALKADLAKNKPLVYEDTRLAPSLYRPFLRQWLYYDRRLDEMVYQMPRIFPMDGGGEGNRVIMIKQRSPAYSQFALMVSSVSELQSDGGTQCFPRWIYDAPEEAGDDELALGTPPQGGTFQRRDAITDAGLAHFQAAYPGEPITKDDLFHYTYGLLHSPDYRTRFADNLSRQLPRVPLVASAADFRAFVEAGQELADLHCGFEEADPCPVTIAQGDLRLAHIPDPVAYFRVEKMKFAGTRPNLDRTSVIYNRNITITGIPLDAYAYVVNGKPALEWVMERQCVKRDPASGIAWDANAFANETVGDPAYPFKLFCRVITVSLRTTEIVRSLPPLDIASNSSVGECDLDAPDSDAGGGLKAADATK